ncbi:MAG TPA: hypothetical protein VIV84_00520 [Burkholderiaceae bacterium]
MQRTARILAVALTSVAAAALVASCATKPPTGPMGFFVTSANPGNGGNLGGLAGADAHCQKLAAGAGAGNRTWRAYLSTAYIPPNATSAVHARDRIGKGPWFNAKGVMIASDVAHLHSASNNLNKQTALTEKGGVVNGRGDTPNQHDILTGTRPDGTAYPGFPGQPSMSCGEWTREANAFAMVGHHDRLQGTPVTDPWADSWNSSHLTVSCSKEDLPKSGGYGAFYCFAAD